MAALSADVADIRALVAELAVEAAEVANALNAVDQFSHVVRLARRAGYAEGRGEHDDRAAAARAAERRAQFQVIPGGKASPAPEAAPRRRPGGAA